MKLSLLSIHEHLSNSINVSRLITYNPNQTFTAPILYTPDNTEFEPGRLYIAEAAALPENLSAAAGTGIICIGEHPLYGLERTNILIVSEETSAAVLFFLVTNLYRKYDEWEKTTLETIAKGTSLEALIDMASGLFSGNILGCYSNNKLVAGKLYSHLLTTEKERSYYKENELPVSIVLENAHINDNIAKEKHGTVTYYAKTPARDFHIMSRFLFVGNKEWGSLSLSDFDHPFKNIEALILDRLGELFELALADGSIMSSETIKPVRNLIQSILDGVSQTHEYVYRQLNKIQISDDSEFVCICIRLDSGSLHHTLVSSVRSKVGSLLHNTFINTKDNDILITSQVTKEQSLSVIVDKIKNLIGDNNCKIGVSNVFNNIENILHYYAQAAEAINLGTLKSENDLVYYYSDHALDYILEQSMSGIPAQFIVHPGILALYTIDKNTGTEHILTLRTYFKNSQNAVRTADELFIHRSTLTYRLEQIKRITGCDWENYKEKLYMMYSIELLLFNQ